MTIKNKHKNKKLIKLKRNVNTMGLPPERPLDEEYLLMEEFISTCMDGKKVVFKQGEILHSAKCNMYGIVTVKRSSSGSHSTFIGQRSYGRLNKWPENVQAALVDHLIMVRN